MEVLSELNCFYSYWSEENQSLIVQFKKTNSKNLCLTFEHLTELAYLVKKLAPLWEIPSICLSSQYETFPIGPSQIELKQFSETELNAFYLELQKIVLGLLFIPQTVIMDLGRGASSLGIDLSLGSDINIANKNMQLNFNHLKNKHLAIYVAIPLLNLHVGPLLTRQWILNTKSLNSHEALKHGLISECYNKHPSEILPQILTNIRRQNTFIRIQTKKAMQESTISIIKNSIVDLRSIGLACNNSQEWKKTPVTRPLEKGKIRQMLQN